MRRLPVYFLIDVSESMAGEPLKEVENGLGMIVRELKKDPYALETAHLAVSAFAGRAKTLVPLTDIVTFYPPRLPLGSGTALGPALLHLSAQMDAEVQATTPERKGDWKPIVFLFTDGVPTDKWEAALDAWKRGWGKRCTMVCVAFGKEVDTSILQRLSEHVLVFHNTGPEAYAAFFRWISASIRASSQGIAAGRQDLNLAPRDAEVVDDLPGAASSGPSGVDNLVATFQARCSASKKPYLIKYRAQGKAAYRLEGAFPLDDTYAELSDPDAAQSGTTVHSESLSGFPHCPQCGNSNGMVMCPCGGLFCLGDQAESVTCPWCGRNLKAGSGSEGGFSIQRTKG